MRAQEQEDHDDDEHDRERQLELDVGDRGADGDGPVAEHVDIDRRRQRRDDARQQGLDAVDHLDDVGAGLPLNVENDRRRGVRPGAELAVLRAADDIGHVREPDRIAVAVGDDGVGVLRGAFELVVGIDRRGLGRAVEISLRRIDVEVADGGADVVDIEAVGGQRLRIELDAHRRPMAAADGDQADAGQLRYLLRQPGLAQVFQVGERHGLRRHRERQDRRIGRVDLGVDRRNRQVARQQIICGVDRCLHFLLGDVEAQIEAELQGDDRGAGRARRRHLVQARHLAELPLQRRGDRRRHHFRAGAGIKGLHLDRRIIDLRQRRQRQERVGDDAGQHDRRHQQRRADRPQNKWFGDVHCIVSLPRAWRCARDRYCCMIAFGKTAVRCSAIMRY